MSDPTRGLYAKYGVSRMDDSPKHQMCEYFVLDLSHDKHAVDAIEAYAQSCEQEYPLLARDLRKKALAMRDTFAGDKP